MWFTWLPQADVNEPGTTRPRGCDGRPTDQRICPQAKPKGGRAPATPPWLVCCAVAASGMRAVTNPRKCKPRPAATDRVNKRGRFWGLVTAGDPSPKPGQRSGVNGPGPPRPAGGMEPEGAPLVEAWRSQAATVNLPKSVVQTRTWPRGAASAGWRRSRRPALSGPGRGPARSLGWPRLFLASFTSQFTPAFTPRLTVHCRRGSIER